MKKKRFTIHNKLPLKKLGLFLIVVILLIAGGKLILSKLSSSENDNYIKVSTVNKMLVFTDIGENELPELLDKKAQSHLEYIDVTLILEHLSQEKTIKFKYEEDKKEQKILKNDWLIVYDELTGLLDKEQMITYENLYLIGDKKTIDGLGDNEVYTDKGVYSYNGIIVKPYLRGAVEVISGSGEILCIRDKNQAESIISNVWITNSSKKGFQIFADGYYIDFDGSYPEGEISEKVADIVMEAGEVSAIRVKEETLNGKILSVQDDGVEIEGYGVIPFAEGFRIYKTHGELKQLSKEDLMLGYEQTDFIVADGKICGGLVVKPISAENIRVLLKTSDYSNIVHETVKVSCSGNYSIIYGDSETEYSGGEVLDINGAEEYWEENRIQVKPKELSEKIQIQNLERSYGSPVYRGTIELLKTDNGFIIINEVPLEEYLYSVIPSEMPTSYGLEALKAQAVCARTYAYKNLSNDTYLEYGAHVDDSTAYQVYGNFEEDDMSIQAVDETNGQVMMFGEEVVNAYYFSTSSGHTTSDGAWGTAEPSSYLEGCFVGAEAELDLQDEETFTNYIKTVDYEAYDRGEGWYRWNFSLTKAHLSELVNSNLKTAEKNKPEVLFVKNGDGEYVNDSIGDIGSVEYVSVRKRGVGGIVEELIITGSEKEIMVMNENVIRQVLAIGAHNIKKQDDTETKGGSLLPSAFLAVEKEEGDEVKFHFYGGGYGHGIGMSQNAAKTMAEQEMTYEEILSVFYKDVELVGLE